MSKKLQFRDYKGNLQNAPMPVGKEVYSYEGGLIRLFLTNKEHLIFSVCYGLSLHENLSYASAAKEVGEATLHSVSCEGLLG